MASSTSGWNLTRVIAYGGNPEVQITPSDGSALSGGFTVNDSSSVLRVGDTIFLTASYYADIPNVNENVFEGEPVPVGSFSVAWSEETTPDTTPRAVFNSSVGTTFTGYTPSPAPNVRVSGQSGNFLRVNGPGPITIRLRITLHTADGSSRTRDFRTTLNIEPQTAAL